MRKLFFASAAAVLLSGSFASADDPFIPNDNDHMEALNVAIGHAAERRGWYGVQIVTSTSQQGSVETSTTTARRVSPGFLLHSDENGNKLVENQYAR